MALNANALTSLAFAKTYLKIPALETSQDSMVEFWINVSSEKLETFTGRKLKKVTGLIDYAHGAGSNTILLKEFPVIAISELKIDSGSLFTDPSTVIPVADYTISDDSLSVLYLNGLFPRGYRNVKITYNAGYDPIPSDIENACLWLVFWYHKAREGAEIGRNSKSKGDESMSFLQDMPKDIKDTIDKYRRMEFPLSGGPIFNE